MILTCDRYKRPIVEGDVCWWENRLHHIAALDGGGKIFLEEITDYQITPLDWISSQEVTLLSEDEFNQRFGNTQKKHAIGEIVVDIEPPCIVDFNREGFTVGNEVHKQVITGIDCSNEKGLGAMLNLSHQMMRCVLFPLSSPLSASVIAAQDRETRQHKLQELES